MTRRIVVLTVLLLFCLSLSVFAAPIVDIPKGKLVLDYGQYSFDVDVSIPGYNTGTTDGVGYHAYSLTYGVSDYTAIIIGSAKTKSFTVDLYDPLADEHRISTQSNKFTDFKVQHKISDTMAFYLGMKYFTAAEDYVTKDGIGNTLGGGGVNYNDNDKYHVGIILNKSLGETTKGYAELGFGDGLAEYEAGVNFIIAPSVTLDVSYKAQEVDLSDSFGNQSEISGKGLGFGLTAKF